MCWMTLYTSYFQGGGEWPIVRMEASSRSGSKNTHWKAPAKPESLYLRLGHEGFFVVTDHALPDGATPTALPFHAFRRGQNLTLQEGYYVPSERNQETLDAFIYLAALNIAIILQATVSSHHTVKVGGFKWLQDLGVENFYYIAVTPPSYEGDPPLDVPFPNGLCGSILDVYCLILPEIRFD
jgi:hypothetical protein